MNNNNIKRCQVHNEASDTFCETCKRISCPMCEECMKHKRMIVDKFVNKYKAHLKPAYLKDYKDNARKIYKIFKEKASLNGEEISLLEGRTRELQETISNSEEGRARDTKLIIETTQHLRSIQLAAFTNSLKEATEEAIRSLDINNKISVEISGYNPELERQKAELSKVERRANKLTWKLEWLDTVTGADGDKLDEDVKLATSLCFVNGVIEESGMSSIISMYKAFPKVHEVFDIDKVIKQKLVDVGGGIKISKLIKVRKDLKGGSQSCSFLSHNGVMATSYCSRDPYRSTFERRLQLTDLLKDRSIDIRASNEIKVGFYDNSMVMLTAKNPPGVCLVEEMFLKKSESILRRIGDLKAQSCTDTSLLHSKRVLLFPSMDMLYELNVDTEKIRRVNCGKKFMSFSNVTGIDTGVKGVIREYGNGDHIYALNNDNTTTLLAEPRGKLDFVYTLIPSSSEPTDFGRALKFNFKGSFSVGTTRYEDTKVPFDRGCTNSIIRLYQDVFLVFDSRKERWCLTKIVVP